MARRVRRQDLRPQGLTAYAERNDRVDKTRTASRASGVRAEQGYIPWCKPWSTRLPCAGPLELHLPLRTHRGGSGSLGQFRRQPEAQRCPGRRDRVVERRSRPAAINTATRTILARRLVPPVFSLPMAPSETFDPIERVQHYWPEADLGDPRKFLAMASVLRLHQLVANAMSQVLKKFGLTLNGYLMLTTIQFSKRGSKLLGRIAEAMTLHPTTVTTLADRLEEKGLVERQPHPSDRRAVFMVITPAGRALLRKTTKALDDADFGLVGITPARAQKLVELLAPVRMLAGDSHHGE